MRWPKPTRSLGNWLSRREATRPHSKFYEQRLRRYVERKQKGARDFAASFVPRSAYGLWLRNATINAANRLGLIQLLFRAQMRTGIELQDYR